MHPKRLSVEEGASAVEFALVSFVLILFVAGIIQFGHIFFQWLELTHSAREGARWAALRNDAGSVSTPGTVRHKVAEAAPGLRPGLTDVQIVIDPEVTTGLTGQPVRVTVSYETPLFAPLMQNIFNVSGTTFTLTSSATQRIE
ncbi:MAG: pilus assembly protein [Coriobacteriia bacterium]|nr:pilus assembly protein [Coriobacteriia bacterium]